MHLLNRSSENTCTSSAQVKEFLHSLRELKEEAGRLRSIRECNRKTTELHPAFPETGPTGRHDA